MSELEKLVRMFEAIKAPAYKCDSVTERRITE